jgi:UPF0716 protein FxsA
LFPLIFLVFVAVPIIEIAIFIKVGGLIGVWQTLALVIGVAVFGTWLLRQQGLQTFTKAQAAMNRGEMPVGEMLDGFFLVLAALLMVTPGLLTDAIGFALLIPASRKALGALLRAWIVRKSVKVQFYQTGGPGSDAEPRDRPGAFGAKGPIIEGEASEVDEPPASDTRLPPRDPRGPGDR